MKKFKKLDFVSEEIGFEVNNSRIYKTNFGAVISIIISILSIILALMIGSEVYERKLPNVSVSHNFLKESIINLKEQLIFFSVEDPNGKSYEDYTKYLNFHAFKLNATNAIPDYNDFLYADVHKCTINDFSAFKGKIDEENIKTYLGVSTNCISFDENYVIKNPFTTANSSFIEFEFSSCQGNNCAGDLELALKEIYVSFFFMNAYVDSDDYKNPIKYYVDAITQGLSRDFLKRKFVRLVNNEFISDNGWLLENKQTFKYMALKSTYDEINPLSHLYPNDMYWITLVSPNIREVGKRSYMKVQDLFAKVGGIINAIIIIVDLLFHNYLRFLFKKDIAKYLISSKNSKTCLNNNNISILNDKSNVNCLSKGMNIENININQHSLKLNSDTHANNMNNNAIYDKEHINNNISKIKHIEFSNKNNLCKSAYIVNNINNNNNNNEFSNSPEEIDKKKSDVVKTIKASQNIKINVDYADYKYYNEYRTKINNTENNILKSSNIFDYDDPNYMHSLQSFKIKTKEELLFQLDNTSYLKYLMFTIFNSNSDKNEFIKHMHTIIREKIDFFKNIKTITED